MSQLTDNLEKHTSLYVDAFNAGDFDTLDRFYTEEAVAVWEPGKPLTGQARREYQREFLARGPRMTAVPRQSFVTGDTALLIVDWVIETIDDAGAPERLEGVGVDVLRLGEDAVWRYAVDDPYGQG
ncbi:nuclear transport factor 2 family protein [Streptomyces scopuliridis]|uniref:Hydrolase n=2 Tax=Streptomyces scopuliridis TaxID=452529 RepID=A0A2T7SZ26_9ACTN|nr:nuclear transport factor 2 family protein [Streptomyces scopuliridis]PVE08159.1 hydrolase [Streptomyces scopuliridis RB72]WSB31854.1 nuclear transport factor 2 family protein [Streptomyces scopuliridis]WSB96112.1 nuclear transport factor 2 family protein [Streptomyces scopuliridis]WSC10182.1 nuclear transport factor 2 family protein [Streptomyces scopuliridis]